MMYDIIKKSILRYLRKWYYWALSFKYHFSHNRIKAFIKKKKTANVCFIASSLPMWRLQDLYDLLSKDSRYKVWILLVPFLTFAEEQRLKSIKELMDFFDYKECSYQLYDPQATLSQWNDNKPDIIFYPQLYSTIYPDPLRIDSNLDKLICYIPYGLKTCKGEVFYNSKYMNIIWKLFYPSQIHAEYARNHSFNKARNVEVVGEPNAKYYLKSNYSYPWKLQANSNAKKVIWAPHFSLSSSGYLHRASFLWLADLMNEMVKRFENEIQFVLKPHPRLITSLYSHPEWGKEKTDHYFERWENGKNTQLETGEFIDLFMTSDAMIHDCSSFTAEYLYTKKPVLFSSKDFQSIYDSLDSFGTECLNLHYFCSSRDDLIHFFESIILEGDDPLLERRIRFYEEVLVKETAGDVGNNIYQIMNKELFDS